MRRTVCRLVGELVGTHWDVLLLNETIRPIREEKWAFEDGHIYAGSGGDAYRHGVGIIVHARWAKYVRRFCPMSDRVAYVDVVSKSLRARFISAYFPHSKYSDTHIQTMYDVLSKTLRNARKRKLHAVIFADTTRKLVQLLFATTRGYAESAHMGRRTPGDDG